MFNMGQHRSKGTHTHLAHIVPPARPKVAAKAFMTAWPVCALIFATLTLTGCGVAFNVLPTVSMSPSSLIWHKVDIGGTSGSKQIIITNTSPAGALPLKISSIKLTGNFIQTANNCPLAPAVLAIGDSCQISIVFRPMSSGSLSGTLSLVDNATNTPAAVSLSATGGVGFLLFKPIELSFPGVASGTTSQPQTATLTNEASTPVEIAKLSTSGHFLEGDNCPLSPNTLAPGGSCDVSVVSSPTTEGQITGSINAEDSFGNVTQLYLSGTDQGAPTVGLLSFSPADLQWGKVTVGQTSGAKTITLSNTSSSSVAISSIATQRDFIIANSTCPVAPLSLGGGATCVVSVAFRPTKAGSISELLTVSTSGGVFGVSLRGTGVIGNLLFSPTSLLFSGVPPGQVSTSQSANLTNETSAAVQISSINISAHFQQTNNCGSTLAAGASCTFTVVAAPMSNGTITGAINVKDSLGNDTALYLQGQGGGENQTLSFSPNPLTWGTVTIGQTSGSKALTVNNGQTVPLTIYSMSIGEDFIITSSTCPTAPTTIPPASSCTLSLAFRPYSSGMKTEDIAFADDAPGGNQSVTLVGTGATGELSFTPPSLSYAGVDPNTSSQPQTATLLNTQAQSVSLASIMVSGHFSETNDCPASLAANAACTFTVTSDPVIDGPTEGSVNVKDAAGAIYQLYLSGMGGIPVDSAQQGSSAVTVVPHNIDFGTVMIGETSTSRMIRVSNNSSVSVSLSQARLSPDIVATQNTCPVAPQRLSAGAACRIAIAFRPQLQGPKREDLSFTNLTAHSKEVIAVKATGEEAPLSFSSGSLTFRSSMVGSAPWPQQVILSNDRTTAVHIDSIQVIGPFAQENDCPKSLRPGARCNIEVFANFQIEGELSGVVNVRDATGRIMQLYLSMFNTNTINRSDVSNAPIASSTPPIHGCGKR